MLIIDRNFLHGFEPVEIFKGAHQDQGQAYQFVFVWHLIEQVCDVSEQEGQYFDGSVQGE